MSEPVTAKYGSREPRLTAGERRERILAAARAEFARAGYHGASTAEIARSAGCSEPMLYKHFTGKQALFTSVLDQVTGIIEGGFDAVLAAEGDLVENLRAALPALLNDPAYVEALRLRKLAITIADEPEVREALLALQQRHLARVRTALQRARREGQVADDVDAEAVAWTWTGLMLAGCYREALEPGGFAAMLPTVDAFIESLRC